ncbi:hypothetical protein GT347_24385 [Xylophilus rhododendri]|uniref:Lipoprotein n=1 Tax=Xylophilus rhododendri TaxID=2697032 RepID=A0A857JDL1_9BURK|nr:hypothetical protein [Xylophilus rhododendri]QHJ00849.1 hypothetical protein GT347_24385 [Xylophilus rhododendri]
MKFIESLRRNGHPFLLLMAAAAALTACGGGDGKTSTEASPSWTDYVGDYTTTCLANSQDDGSHQITGTLAVDANGKYTAIARLVTYSSAFCNTATITSEVQAGFDLKPLDGVKNIVSTDPTRPSGPANKLEATLVNATAKMGQMSGSTPVLGVKLTVGYMLRDKSIRFLSGTREADGLGKFFSSAVLTKVEPPPVQPQPEASGS